MATETLDARAKRIVYASPDGGDLTREEIAYGQIIKVEGVDGEPPCPAPYKAMTYSFDACGVALQRGWAFFNNTLEYEMRRDDQSDRFDNRQVYRYDWFRIHLPYLVIPIRPDIAKHLYLPLNREYKPLGIPRSEFVDYDAYAHKAMRFARDPRTFTGVWTDDRLYLYDDTSKFDYELYFARLAKLFTYKVTA